LTMTGSGCEGSTSLMRRTQAGRRASERLRCGRYMACLPVPIPSPRDAVVYLANNILLAIYAVKGWRYIAGAIYVHTDPMTGRVMAIRVRLRDLLEKRGMAQTELQARSGLGYSTINALYHGKTERVEFATLEALC